MDASFVQTAGKTCWGVVVLAMVSGLVMSNGGPDRSKLKASPDDKPELLLNGNLAVVTSDFWVHALVSSIGAVGITCALVEKMILLDGWASSAASSSSVQSDVNDLLRNSDGFFLNLWVGVLVKSMALSNAWSDLYTRKAKSTVLQGSLVLGETLVFALFLAIYELSVLPIEDMIRSETRSPVVVQKIELLVSSLAFGAFLVLCLAIVPFVRYYTSSRYLHEEQLEVASGAMHQHHAEKLKSQTKPVEEQGKSCTKSSKTTQSATRVGQASDESDDCKNEQAVAEKAARAPERANKSRETSPNGDAALVEQQIQSESNVANAPVQKQSDEFNSGKEQNQDLLVGGILCVAGLALTAIISRRIR